MSVQNTTRISCDYPECKGGQSGPVVVQFNQEEIKAGKPAPTELAEFIILEMNGQKLAFCGKLHASKTFLPAGYDIVPKKIVEFPNNGNFTEQEPA